MMIVFWHRREVDRLEADHPEWKWMDSEEVHRRFWAYSAGNVALARLEVYRRRFLRRLARWLVSAANVSVAWTDLRK